MNRQDAVKEMDKAIMALYLQVPKEVADSIHTIWKVVNDFGEQEIKELHSIVENLKREAGLKDIAIIESNHVMNQMDGEILKLKRELQEKEEEIERLKKIIEVQARQLFGWDMEKKEDGTYSVFQSGEAAEKEWQQFKKDNKL